MVLLGLRTIFDGSTFLRVFLANGKYITITHSFHDLPHHVPSLGFPYLRPLLL